MNTQFTVSEANLMIQLLTDKHTIETTIERLTNPRYKKEEQDKIPFSERLNQWITNWMVDNCDKFIFTDVDDFDPCDLEGSLSRYREIYMRTGKILIWTGASDNTIFASPTINHYFRAWHDYIHITENIGFDFMGETAVAQIQKAQLPFDWGFEKSLIDAEIVGQALHHTYYGEFVKDQRGFALEFIKTGKSLSF